MSDRVGTRGVSLDFSKLAGKGWGSDIQLVGKSRNSEMSVKEKYGVQTVKMSKKRDEGTHKSQNKCSRNVFDNVNLGSCFGKSSISKMAAIDAND